MMTLQQALDLLGGRATLVGDGATAVQRVHSDTRTLQPGDLFVALRGERFDAHDFLPQARAAGAVAALAEHGVAAAGLPGLVVSDALLALQNLAAAWRRSIPLPLIAVTGSNGKTTVTQMIAAILRAWLGDAAFATEGNLNNHIGLPLTLLRLRAGPTLTHRAGVVELGTNHVGEIALLARLAAPNLALVNNAQREHQEFMATVEAVAHENGAVLAALPEGGVAVYPAGDAHQAIWDGLAGARRRLRFGAADDGAGVSLTEAAWRLDHWRVRAQAPEGTLAFALHIAGRHNLHNALAAIACASAAGVPAAAIEQGLGSFRPVKGRSRSLLLRQRGRAITLIDDSYNANPDSMRALIDTLAELPGPRLLVLGDMGEVGDQGPAFHAEIGAYARERGIERLLAHGPLAIHAAMAFGGGRHFDDMAALTGAVRTHLAQCASIAVKGSRFMRMERVVEALAASEAEGPHAA